jgi:hypothetical protein
MECKHPPPPPPQVVPDHYIEVVWVVDQDGKVAFLSNLEVPPLPYLFFSLLFFSSLLPSLLSNLLSSLFLSLLFSYFLSFYLFSSLPPLRAHNWTPLIVLARLSPPMCIISS